MTQKGTHTWDLTVDYQRCPNCGFINESREMFHYFQGKWTKEIECERCHYRFTVVKARELTFGPLIGEPQPTEVDWE